MKLTRQQRINNVGSNMIQELTVAAQNYRKLLKDGLDIPAGAPGAEGYPALKTTGEEVRAALGENLKPFETAIEFILDGKSNRITKGVKKK